MFVKFTNFFKKISLFLKANLFIFITASLVVIKLLYFNISFDLVGEAGTAIALVVVTFVLVFLFFSPISFAAKKRIKYATILNLFFGLIILAGTIYIRYFNSLPSVQSIFYADAAFGVMDSIWKLVHFKDIFIFIDIPIMIMVFRSLKQKKIIFFEKPSQNLHNFLFCGFCFFCFLFIIFYDFKNVKLLTTRVFDNRVITERYGITGYLFFDIYHFSASQLSHLSPEEKEEAINQAKDYIPKPEKNSKTGLAKGKNIIFIQVESLQTSAINKKIEGQELTPNLNKFIEKSDYFNNHYYQMGFGGTADSDFTANTALYPLRNASTFVQYGKDYYTGLATELAKNGYNTETFHGFNRSFWNRNVALKSLGYQKFYGAESYQGLEKTGMGVADTEFYQKTTDYLKLSKSPSLSYVISLTSHFPFPYQQQELELKKNYSKTTHDYYQSIHYADKSLGIFFEELKKEGLYDNSLIIVYGDHAAALGNSADIKNAQALGHEGIPSEKQKIEMKKVPLIIHFPGQTKGVKHEEVSSHLDIMPTILNLVGIKPETPIFGRDLYDQSLPYFASVLYFENGFIETNDYVYLDGLIEGVENGRCYLIKNGGWLKASNNQCQTIVEKRDKEIDLSEKLIKYNLLKKVKN